MKRNKGEVVIATVVVLLVSAFCGLIYAGSGPSKSADAGTVQVAEAK